MTAPDMFLWSEVVLLWAIGNYSVRDPTNDPDEKRDIRFWKRAEIWHGLVIIRSVAATLLTWAICRSSALSLLVLAGSITLPLLRSRIPARRTAELEIAATVAFLIVSWELITFRHLRAVWGLLPAPLSESRTTTVMFIAAAAVFVVHGGTFIVRGILDKSGALPKLERSGTVPSQVKDVDVAELNRGRLIGALERLLLLAVVIAGSYEALAFLMAAKGLIRSKDLEDRAWAEYFLVGSLASVLVALFAGLGAQYAVKTFW